MRTLCNHIILNTQQWKNIRSSNYWTLHGKCTRY